jgi:putative Mn2+ efflux pump MntP
VYNIRILHNIINRKDFIISMGLLDLLLTALALSADAFAVSVCKGLAMRLLKVGQAIIVGLYFGIAQAAMPVIGYYLGKSFENRIKAYDHWIAFALLGFIGIRMLWEVIKERHIDADKCPAAGVGFRLMLPLAVATSIDALAVGVSFAFLGVSIWSAAPVIGLITFTLSFTGVGIGCFFGSRFRRAAQVAGGIILVLLGTKILAEHLVL